jgi:hypothetical protein
MPAVSSSAREDFGVVRLGRGEENNEVVLQEKKMFRAKGGTKVYFWWTETYFATATEHTCSNIISREMFLHIYLLNKNSKGNSQIKGASGRGLSAAPQSHSHKPSYAEARDKR